MALVAPRPAAASPGSPSAGPNIDWTLSAARITANCAAAIARTKAGVDAIARIAPSRRTFATVVRPLEDVTSDLNDDLVAETTLVQVSPNRAVRDASEACQNDVNDLYAAITARPDLYAAVSSAASGATAQTVADRKLSELWVTQLRRAGAALSQADRTRFVALNQQLNTLQAQFAENLANDKTTVVINKGQTAGLPADFLATLAPAADGGGLVVPVNESTAPRFMESAADPSARKAYYLAYNNRGVPRNEEVLRAAIAARDEAAHLIGYPTWADYVLADRMAANPARVRSFLDDLDAKLLPRAADDLAALAALKARTTHERAASIDPWDVAYYDNLLRKTKYAVDADRVREYFPVDHVVASVLDIYAKMLGVTFARRDPANVWSQDVTQWSISDTASGRYIGDFYLDLFPRDGKYSHVASFPLLPNRRLASGALRPPLDAIIGNWPAPAPGKPALLSHDEVVTFFHEFGHDMATMLATAPYETLSAGFRWDFIEAPSQMLENWVWDPAILRHISANVATGAPLPDEIIKKMIAARYVDDAYFTTRQILYADVDLDYHTAGATVDLSGTWARVASAVSPLGSYPGTHPEASFGHIMGGYDAGYYGYLWSKVYAQDMFTAFRQGGLEDPATGSRYRTDILEPARELEPDQEVANFLGRPMSPVAFYRELGIDVKAAAAQ